jgi:hypothetical protein
MVYNKTAWKDRVVEKPLTFTLQNNADGTVTLIPAEGQIIEPGTSINAVNMNNIEKQYDEAISWVNGFGLGAVAKDISNTDLNVLDATGFYKGNSLVNSPTNAIDYYFFVINQKHDNNNRAQIAILYYTQGTKLHHRNQAGGIWSAWKELATTDYVKSFGLGVDANQTNIPDANSLTKNGFYVTNDVFTGSPFAGSSGANQGYLEHHQWLSPGYASQTHTQINGEKKRRIRHKDNGVWGAWVEVLTDASPTWTNFTMQNGATSGPTYPLRYSRTGNEVTISGLLNSGVANGTVFATLPTGYRPSRLLMKPLSPNSTAGSQATVQINTLGQLSLVQQYASAGHFLEFSFIAEQ